MALLKEIAPAEYHDRGYLKDLLDKEQTPETFGALFKKLDNAETLIGKKVGIPAADAKDEEWEGFLSKLKPEKADDYEIPAEEGAKTDADFLKIIRDAFMAGNINKRQANKFLTDFQPKLKAYTEAKMKPQRDAQAKADADFETLAKAALGDGNKAVMARVKEALNEHTPAAVKPYLDKLDNNSLVIIAGVIDAIQRKYMPEDKLNPAGGNGNAGGDAQSKRDEAMAIMAMPEYKDQFHPKHQGLVDKVKAIYAELAKK